MAYKLVEKQCQQCGKDFMGRPASRFCGHQCGALAIAEQRRQAGRKRGVCSMQGCGRELHSLGFCRMHRKRVKRNGVPKNIKDCKPSDISIHDWFMSKVNKTETCWLWTGAIMVNRGGYGTFYDGSIGKKLRAHHFLVGKPGPGMEYDHLCRNVVCVRPDHLELVTPRVNRQRQHQRRLLD